VLTQKEIAVLTLRKEGLTQVEVAKRLTITQAAVSKFEQNAKQKLRDAHEIIKLAEALGLDAEEPMDRLLKEIRGGKR
jgi:transcriptional regulator